MNRHETISLLEGIDAMWRGFSRSPIKDAIWISVLEHVPPEHAEAGLMALVKTCKFPPSAADLFEACYGRPVREPVEAKDCWGRTILRSSGEPMIEGYILRRAGGCCPVTEVLKQALGLCQSYEVPSGPGLRELPE